jgi:hypothetical protein
MIAEFNKITGKPDIKQFYLALSRNIQKNYELSSNTTKDKDTLLLRLRKNSLLLQLPSFFDYVKMQLAIEPPPNNEAGLMTYSLQKTIEYYSQVGGDQKERFKELNIQKEPEMSWNVNVVGTDVSVSGIDKRFTKGIPNMKETCFFNTALQLLLCDDDFIQLMIQGNCQDNFLNSITNLNLKNDEGNDMCPIEKFDKSKQIIKNFLTFFNKWLKNEPFDSSDITNNPIYLLVSELSDSEFGTQADATEILSRLFGKIDCMGNAFIQKFIDNLNFTITEYIENPTIDNKKIEDSSKTDKPFNFTPLKIDTDKSKIDTDKSPDDINKETYNLTDLIKKNFINDDPKEFLLSFSKNKDNQSMFPGRYKVFQILRNLELNGTISTLQNIATSYTNSSSIKINLEKVPDKIDFNNLSLLNESEYTDFFTGYKKPDEIKRYPETWSSHNPQSERLKLIDKTIIKTLETKLTELNNKISSLASTGDSDTIRNQFMNDNALSIRTIFMIIGDIIDVIARPLKTDGSAYEAVTKKSIKKIGKYFSSYVNRTYQIPNTSKAGRYDFKIKIDPKITLNVNGTDTTFILLGFMTHIPGHYYYIKCDKNGNNVLEISDSRITLAKGKDYSSQITGFIYKKEDNQAGGGFKPKHNATTTHTTPKSKHNSSFKSSSSSKSKSKSHSRSHTQRVK